MLLSDKSIRDQQRQHKLVKPFKDEHVQPGSYEVTLADKYLLQSYRECSRPNVSGWSHTYNHPGRDYVCDDGWEWVEHTWTERPQLQPNDFVLATTVETISLPSNLTARVEGKSSLGRLGLLVHVTAGFIDAGFTGQVTLELKNLAHNNIELAKGRKIGQLAFFAMTSPAEFPYGHQALGSHYQGQRGATTSTLENS